MNIDLNETITTTQKVNTPIDHGRCVELYDNGDGIYGFIGGFEKPIAFLNEEVPVEFINSSKVKTEILEQIVEYQEYNEELNDFVTKTKVQDVEVSIQDQDGNPVLVQKKWSEYCLHNVSNDGTEAVFHFLHVFPNGCRKRLDKDLECEQWRLWYNKFDMFTKSEFNSILKSDKYVIEEPSI